MVATNPFQGGDNWDRAPQRSDVRFRAAASGASQGRSTQGVTIQAAGGARSTDRPAPAALPDRLVLGPDAPGGVAEFLTSLVVRCRGGPEPRRMRRDLRSHRPTSSVRVLLLFRTRILSNSGVCPEMKLPRAAPAGGAGSRAIVCMGSSRVRIRNEEGRRGPGAPIPCGVVSDQGPRRPPRHKSRRLYSGPLEWEKARHLSKD